jgi:hypothetical protein
VLRVKVPAQCGLVAVVGHHAAIFSAGEFINATGCWVSDQELETSLIASVLASEPQDGDLMADTVDGEHACCWGPLPPGADDRRLSLNPRGLVQMDIEVDDLWRTTGPARQPQCHAAGRHA